MTDRELFLFSSTGHREKVHCTICGRAGYAGGPWQDACRAGHPWACSCGRRFSGRAGIAAHVRRAGQGHAIASRPTTGR